MSEFYTDPVSSDPVTVSPVKTDAVFPRRNMSKTKFSLTPTCKKILPREYAEAQEMRESVNDEDEGEYVTCLFTEGSVKNEAAFLLRTEELISLRAALLYNPAAPFIITPYIPLNILSKKTVLKGSVMHNIFSRNPWRVEITNDMTYSEIDLLSGKVVLAGVMTSPARHEGKRIVYTEKTDMYYHEDDRRIVMTKPRDSNSPIFYRGKYGRVVAYAEYNHFLCNNLLYVKEYLGEMGGLSVYQIYLESHPELKETILLKNRNSPIFLHACEWYECYRDTILHVRSMRKEEIVKQGGLIKLVHYYKGQLLLVLMNGVTELLTLV
jgi:hypothetical protein